jgi:polyhydroxyalkanoate synthesis regulator phasin
VEKDELVTNCDRFKKLKHSSSLPYAFTEQGVAMLSAVLRSNTAIKTSISIMNAFVAMRQFIQTNTALVQRMNFLEIQHIALAKDTQSQFDKVFSELADKNKLEPTQGVFFEGQIFDAYRFVSDLLRQAKHSVVLIDNYIDDRVLDQLNKRASGVTATILCKKVSRSLQNDLDRHNAQYPAISAVVFEHSHDRFLILDGHIVYHLGASLKDLGNKWFAFSKLDQSGLKVMDRVRALLP